MPDTHKYVYSFGGGKAEGKADMKALLGGKGANLAEMSVIGIPVPPGFTITTEVCAAYYENGKKLPEATPPPGRGRHQARRGPARAKLGDPADPLLVSVRSGAALSMPGMMNTILNLGLSDVVDRGPRQEDRQRPVRLRRLSTPDRHVRLGRHGRRPRALRARTARSSRRSEAVHLDTDLSGDDLKLLVQKYKAVYKAGTGTGLPPRPEGPALGGDHGRLQ